MEIEEDMSFPAVAQLAILSEGVHEFEPPLKENIYKQINKREQSNHFGLYETGLFHVTVL